MRSERDRKIEEAASALHDALIDHMEQPRRKAWPMRLYLAHRELSQTLALPDHGGRDLPLPRCRIEKDSSWHGGERYRLFVEVGGVERDLVSTSKMSESNYGLDAIRAYLRVVESMQDDPEQVARRAAEHGAREMALAQANARANDMVCFASPKKIAHDYVEALRRGEVKS